MPNRARPSSPTRGLTRAALVSLLLAVPDAAAAAGCTLLEHPRAEGAKLKVFFTRFAREDTSAGKFKQCRLVTQAEAETVRFFVTPFRQDADVVVHTDNWPR
jgi:hypothetical protein